MSSSSWSVSVVKFASFKGWSLKEEQGPLPSLCMDCHFLNTNMAWLHQGGGGGGRGGGGGDQSKEEFSRDYYPGEHTKDQSFDQNCRFHSQNYFIVKTIS